MNYPLISEYISAILSAGDNFDCLCHLYPILDIDGQPIMSSGNFAVVFKMTDGVNFFAVKCFLKDQPQREANYFLISNYLNSIQSPYLVSFKYYKDELFVDTQQSDITEYPVVLMDWVEGKTLNDYFNTSFIHDDMTSEHNTNFFINLLCYNFFEFSKWIISLPFAHGDLKPDNILVQKDGSIRLIDYDGMFVPKMTGQKPMEFGTPNYRKPNDSRFDRHIDDFAIVSIMLSLLGSEEQYTELTEFEYYNFSESDFGKIIFSKSSNIYTKHFLALYLMMQTSNFNLSLSDFDIEFEKPKWFYNSLLVDCDIDEYGVIYTEGFKRLLYFPNNSTLTEYKVIDACEEIADDSFVGIYDPDPEFGLSIIGNKLQSITLSNKLKRIGTCAFVGCTNLSTITLPDSVSYIGDKAFEFCDLLEIELPESLKHLGKSSLPSSLIKFTSKSNNIILRKSKEGTRFLFDKESCTLIKIDKNALSFTIPNDVKVIETHAFAWCRNLQKELLIPSNVSVINDYAFWNSSIRVITLMSTECRLSEESFYVEPAWGRKYIEGSKSISTLIVPCEKGKYYKEQLGETNIKISETEKPISKLFLDDDTPIKNAYKAIRNIPYSQKTSSSIFDTLSDFNIPKRECTAVFSELYKQVAYKRDEYKTIYAAICFIKGFGTEIDYRKAYSLLTQDYVSNNGEGLFWLGYLFFCGLGVTKDITKAFTLFNQSANLGFSDAEYVLHQLQYFYLVQNNFLSFSFLVPIPGGTYTDGTATYNADCSKLFTYGGGRGETMFEYKVKEGTKYICNECFNDLYNEIEGYYLNKVSLPKSLLRIGDNAFCMVSSIISESPYFIVEDNFLKSSNKKILYRYIGNQKTISIPNGTIYIKGGAFSGYYDFEQIIIPPSVLALGDNPFAGISTSSLHVISNSENIKIEDDILYDVHQRRVIAYLGNSECVKIKYGTKFISKNAFYGSNVKQISLPSSLILIDEDAFSWCFQLNKISVHENVYDLLPSYLKKYNDPIIEIIEDLLPF